jgi:hypothetical protein
MIETAQVGAKPKRSRADYGHHVTDRGIEGYGRRHRDHESRGREEQR